MTGEVDLLDLRPQHEIDSTTSDTAAFSAETCACMKRTWDMAMGAAAAALAVPGTQDSG